MSKRLTASVVGCGMGGRLSIDALLASDAFDLVAAADISEAGREHAAADYPNLQLFDEPGRMFEACPTDVICISTWAPSHLPLTLQALKVSGLKGLLVEKPLGDTAANGQSILGAVTQAQIPMAVPHGLLVAPHVEQIIQRVRTGQIGELKLVEIQNRGWDIINAGIHWLNFFVALTDSEPMAFVMAACDTSTRTYRDGMQVETLGVIYAQTVSGIRVVMNTGDHVEINTPDTGCVFRIIGTQGLIEFWAWKSAYWIVNQEYPKGERIKVPQSNRTRHQIHLENLADQIRQGTCDFTVAKSSLMALELCEGAYLSHRHRCCVTFPLDRFQPTQLSNWDPGKPYAGTGGGRDGKNL